MPDVSDAQRQLLEAALTSTPLPGTSRPVRLPDIDFVLARQPPKVAIDELADPNILSRLALNVEGRSEKELTAAEPGLESAYLAFQASEFDDVTLVLTLQIRLAPGPAQHPQGLSGIQVRFQPVAGAWRGNDNWILMAA